MGKRVIILGITACFFFLGISSCNEDKNNINSKVILDVPGEFVSMVIPDDNQLTKEGVELGRLLFYDPILSLDSTVSCASCHQQALAFTDGRRKSIGINERMGRRSALSLANVGFNYKGLFWDGRSPSLEEQALHPVTDNNEMGHTWPSLLQKLNRNRFYQQKFQVAYPLQVPKKITQKQVANALAQFQRTLISTNSKYDQVLEGKASFSAAEARGMDIFFDKSDILPVAECGHCHTDPLFTNLNFENNGIDSFDSHNPDKGRAEISGRKYDKGMFKVPTLRNIAVTAPYMHDGRFQSLEEVIDHYNTGGHPGINVSPNVMPLHLNERDKADLIAFLNTLTDETFLNNPELSNPFMVKSRK